MSAGAGAMTARRPRIYGAHPVVSYASEHERACLDTLAGLFGDVEIINPAERSWTNAGWRRAWPRLLTSLAGLVFFADERDTVGAGCLREVTDAIAAGVPVGYLDPCFGLREVARSALLPVPIRTRASTAWPIAGAQIDDPGSLCRTVEASARCPEASSDCWLPLLVVGRFLRARCSAHLAIVFHSHHGHDPGASGVGIVPLLTQR